MLLDNRRKILERYCRNKTILDIGSVGGIGNSSQPDKFTHDIIRGVAKEVVGLDYSKKAVEYWNSRGYNLIHADAGDSNLDLGRKFEVIFAGEVMEHIENQGIFLNNVKKHLHEDGVFIVSTPNSHDIAYHLNRFLLRIKDDYAICKNIGHVVVHSYGTLKHLLERYGFNIVESHYINSICLTWRRSLLKSITYFFNDFAESIIFVARVEKIESDDP